MSPCDQMSRSGTRAARRLVRSAQSRPLVARIAMSLLRSSITANPSGYATRILRTVTWKFTSVPRDQRHIVRTCERASRPIGLSLSRETLPLVAVSRIFEATCVRAPICRPKTLSHISSSTARKSAMVAVSNMRCPQKGKSHLSPVLPACGFGMLAFVENTTELETGARLGADAPPAALAKGREGTRPAPSVHSPQCLSIAPRTN
ncbi:hypothetical protein ABIA06_002972 [Bradyrhizobium yuanmingense]